MKWSVKNISELVYKISRQRSRTLELENAVPRPAQYSSISTSIEDFKTMS